MNVDLHAAELALEEEAVEVARRRYRESVAARPLTELPPGMQLMRRSVDSVIAGVQEWLDDAANGKAGRAVGLAKFLSQYDADEVALVALRQALVAISARNVKLTNSAMALTAQLESVDLVDRLKQANKQVYLRYVRFSKRHANRDASRRLAILKKQFEYTGTFSDKATFAWTDSERLQVGVRLLEIVSERTGIIQFRVADVGGKHPAHVIEATPSALEWIEHAHKVCEMARPAFYPMVVPPVDWEGVTGGGYLRSTNGFRKRLMKNTDGGFRAELASMPLPEVCDAVNALQRTPWRVNKRVLAVVQRLLDGGEVTAGLPANVRDIEEPQRHAFMDREKETWSPEEEQQFIDWKRARSNYEGVIASLVSKRFNLDQVRRVSERVADFERIYFPHTLDFRGRAYPMSSALNPQGNDMSKGLLEFADAVPLGQHGMRWLAIHGANSYGVDKVSFTERVRWVKENFAAILADADDPHREGALWKGADSPFVFLAFCFEWADMARHGDAATFESRLPVGLDGSCNGLQHFSAMLRDEIGGAATNLTPSERPSDIYSLVAAEVNKLVQMDLASDDEDTRTYARFWLDKGITRKWTKRNTMTLPYGVSRFGMKDQLWAEIGTSNANEFFGEGIARGACVRYLADKNWTAVGRVVVAARNAMDWLQEVAKIVSNVKLEGVKARGLPVQWDTPDGLPLQQKYLNKDEVQVQVFGAKYCLTLRPLRDDINGRRQVSGLSPNFVHSIDATHMRMVVRRLVGEGVSAFAMIHDSFGTHAGNVERLSEVTREEFVTLHEQDVLEKFRDGIVAALPEGAEVPPLPPRGSLDLSAVTASSYFFA